MLAPSGSTGPAAMLRMAGGRAGPGLCAAAEHTRLMPPLWGSVACRGFAAKPAKGGKSASGRTPH